MASRSLWEAGLDPTSDESAGVLPSIGSEHRIGCGDVIIAEACEYTNSFLRFKPTIAAILNIEEDHLDFSEGLDDILISFRTFRGLVPEDGPVVVNCDDVTS